MKDIKFLLVMIASFIGLIIVGMLTVFLIAWAIDPLFSRTCHRQFGSFIHTYSFWEGCMIKVDGKWIPEQNFIINSQAK